jgi:hypothetical protein
MDNKTFGDSKSGFTSDKSTSGVIGKESKDETDGSRYGIKFYDKQDQAVGDLFRLQPGSQCFVKVRSGRHNAGNYKWTVTSQRTVDQSAPTQVSAAEGPVRALFDADDHEELPPYSLHPPVTGSVTSNQARSEGGPSRHEQTAPMSTDLRVQYAHTAYIIPLTSDSFTRFSKLPHLKDSDITVGGDGNYTLAVKKQ